MIRRALSIGAVTIAALAVPTGALRAQQSASPPPSGAARRDQPAPPANTNPVVVVEPAADAIAQCKDGTWIKAPGVVADCAKFGGLNIAMPPRRTPPPVAQAAPSRIRSVVTADGPPPSGATARCKDGTYLFTPANEHSCDSRGGLVVLISPKPAPPTPPRRP